MKQHRKPIDNQVESMFIFIIKRRSNSENFQNSWKCIWLDATGCKKSVNFLQPGSCKHGLF